MEPPPLVDSRVLRPSQTALALRLLTPTELLKLKAIARLYARGLPPAVCWEDLLQEAITRALVGTRVQPAGVGLVAFLAGVMRSLKAGHWRRAQTGQVRPVAHSREEGEGEVELLDPHADLERALAARQEVAAIEQLFAEDRVVLRIIDGLAAGLSAEEICSSVPLSRTEYDSARKRMRRVLLREGLTCAK